ncbi:MAG: ethanolamine permease [Kordiimonadaceae bacterium]|nr:ethanolamine permease [Kordiimonadaceae bacterium]
MADRKSSVTYQKADASYLAKRGLKRYAGVWTLWALGVGAVISGDFFGWNFGLAVGGFGGLLIATIITAIMYIGLCFSIAEMSPALPHTGGAYSFSRTTMGPWAGYITGLAENMEYVLTPAVLVVAIGGYLGSIFNSMFGLEIPDPLWWLFAYAIFVGINIIGVEITFKFTVVTTFVALAVLMVFWIGAIPHFSLDRALDIVPEAGNSIWLPFGWSGVAAALPFAIWFYLAIEQLPLAAEEAHDPVRDMPRGLLWGILTLIIASFLTLFLNSGIAPGAAAVGASTEPLFLAFQTIFGEGMGASLLALVAVAGLIASFHSIIYAYGRNIYSLSRAGYFPKWLSVTHSTRKTPHIALLAGAVLGYVVALLIQYGEGYFGSVPVGAVLLNMAVFGAVIAYIMQMIAFVKLRKMPGIKRPYISPLGNTGAIVAGLIALFTLVFLFMNTEYRVGIWGALIWFIIGLAYFAFYARHQMILSPEEEFAIEQLKKSKKTP